MQPYQTAGEEIKRQGELPLKYLKAGASLAATGGSAIAGGKILSKVMPFLNSYIPQELAVKGLSKIDPRFGNFIDKALSAGKSFDEIKEFIKEKTDQGSEEQLKSPLDTLMGLSPELTEVIREQIQKGQTPQAAAAYAKIHPKSSKHVDKIEKELKEDFIDYIGRLFGQTSQQPQKPQQQTTQGTQGQGQQALMAILQKIQQQRGG